MVATVEMIFLKIKSTDQKYYGDRTASPGGGTTLGGGTPYRLNLTNVHSVQVD